jgi:hypothetical protein
VEFGELLAVLSHQKCQVLRRHCGERCGELGQDRNSEANLRLLLLELESTIVDMLAAHMQDIAAALGAVEEQLEREARHGADRVARAVSLDMRLGPSEEAIGLRRFDLDADRRIDRDHAFGDRVLHQVANRLQPIPPCERLGDLLQPANDVAAF